MTWIETRSGQKFDLANPDKNDVRLDDIAYALSRICRFNGHCVRHYSVAEHCIIMSLGLGGISHRLALLALLHDAHEAYVGDISAPMKQALDCSRLKEIVSAVDSAIYDRFELAPPNSDELEQIKKADLQMLQAERLQVMEAKCHWPVLDGIDSGFFAIPTQRTVSQVEGKYRALFKSLFYGLKGWVPQ